MSTFLSLRIMKSCTKGVPPIETHGKLVYPLVVPDVVYTCGALERAGEIWMYYGGADTVIGLAIARTADLVDLSWSTIFCMKNYDR